VDSKPGEGTSFEVYLPRHSEQFVPERRKIDEGEKLRGYWRASSFELASETICALSGTQFDPRVVAAFVSIPEKTWPATATNQQRVAALSSPYPGDLEILREGLG